MPIIYYRDPADSTFKPLVVPGGGGGTGADEVVISATQPTDAAVELWMDPTGDGSGDGWAQFDARYATTDYVDQLITVSSAAPTGTPARDGLVWIVVAP